MSHQPYQSEQESMEQMFPLSCVWNAALSPSLQPQTGTILGREFYSGHKNCQLETLCFFEALGHTEGI